MAGSAIIAGAGVPTNFMVQSGLGGNNEDRKHLKRAARGIRARTERYAYCAGALLRQRDDIQFALDAGTKVIDGLQHAIEMLEEEGNKA